MQLFLFFLIDTHWHCCAFFLPFLHLFFLPVAWPIDLAVQGCKYHCVFFHSRPSLLYLFFSSVCVHVHSLTSCYPRWEYWQRFWVARGFCCMKDFTPCRPSCRLTSPLVEGLALPNIRHGLETLCKTTSIYRLRSEFLNAATIVTFPLKVWHLCNLFLLCVAFIGLPETQPLYCHSG